MALGIVMVWGVTGPLFGFSDTWQLVINKQTGQWGTQYDQSMDLGRAKMTMSKPSSTVETFKITLSDKGGSKGELRMEWEDSVATVPIVVH